MSFFAVWRGRAGEDVVLERREEKLLKSLWEGEGEEGEGGE